MLSDSRICRVKAKESQTCIVRILVLQVLHLAIHPAKLVHVLLFCLLVGHQEPRDAKERFLFLDRAVLRDVQRETGVSFSLEGGFLGGQVDVLSM